MLRTVLPLAPFSNGNKTLFATSSSGRFGCLMVVRLAYLAFVFQVKGSTTCHRQAQCIGCCESRIAILLTSPAPGADGASLSTVSGV